MGGGLSLQTQRALLEQMASASRKAPPTQKRVLLDVCIQTTGFYCISAQWLLKLGEEVLHRVARHPRQSRYGPGVLDLLVLAWNANHRKCTSCLIPFLLTLLDALEQYGHLHEALRENVSSVKKKADRSPLVPESSVQQFSAQDAVWLFVRDPSDLEKKEQEELVAIRQASPIAETLYRLAQEFMYMIRHLKGERLDDWLTCVRASQIPELQPLGKSIERDKAAVLAGLTFTHNNGVVEGKVNKLKLIKRMMFGRAGFALLRQRVLHAL